jgi:hypothetical protein
MHTGLYRGVSETHALRLRLLGSYPPLSRMGCVKRVQTLTSLVLLPSFVLYGYFFCSCLLAPLRSDEEK